MLIVRRLSFLVILTLVLAACSTSQQRHAGAKDDVAIIKGKAYKVHKVILAPLGAEVLNIDIRNIDGKNLFNPWSGAPTQIELKPGLHTLGIGCYGAHNKTDFFGVTWVKVDVKGGEVYQPHLTFDTPQTCSVELLRVGGNSTAIAEAKTAPVSKATDQSRIIFLNAQKGPVLFPKGVRIQIDDTTTGFVDIGTYKIISIPPGRYRISVDMPDLVGECELQLSVQPSNNYYFKVFKNSDIASFSETGASANDIAGDVKKCEGAFALQLLTEDNAKDMMNVLLRK